MAKYLDATGVGTLWNKCKDTFGTVKTVNGNSPDANGDVTISGGSAQPVLTQQSVATALNIGNAMTTNDWGTTTTAAGYDVKLRADQGNGGSFVISEKNGQTFFQVDGEIYVAEGQKRLAHIDEVPSKYFDCIGVDRNTNIGNKNGYWAGMSTQIGPSNSWWHILSMDWSGSDQTNWFSQLALPTQDTKGMYYRKNNSGGTAIGSSTWHKVYTDENTYRHNIIIVDNNHNLTISFQLVTSDASSYSISQVYSALVNAGYTGTASYNAKCLYATGRSNSNAVIGVCAHTNNDSIGFKYTSSGGWAYDWWSQSTFYVEQDKVE